MMKSIKEGGRKEIMKNNIQKLVLSAFFLALGIVLPFMTMQIPELGNMLLPMHIPVLLCGFLCGAPYGAVVGLIVPILRSLLFGAPPMIPIAISMAVELMVYGAVSGYLYNKLKTKKFGIYATLIPAMLIGRVAWGAVSWLVFRALGNPFTWMIFVTQAFINAIPGIVLQLILIPVVLVSVNRYLQKQQS